MPLLRSAVLTLALTSLVLVPTPPPAGAFRLSNVEVWRTDELRWYNDTGRASWARAMRRAVMAWNRNRIGIRFVETSRKKRAHIFIAAVAGPCQADVGAAPTVYANRMPVHATVAVRTACRGRIRDVVMAHELGHILGLKHTRQGCALMRSALPAGACRGKILQRLVLPDDMRGARRMYRRPPALRGVRFEHVPCESASCEEGRVRVSWQTPRNRQVRWVGLRTGTDPDGSCVERFNDVHVGRDPHAETVVARPGKRQTVLWPEGFIGKRCLTVGAIGPRAQMARRVDRFRYSVLPASRSNARTTGGISIRTSRTSTAIPPPALSTEQTSSTARTRRPIATVRRDSGSNGTSAIRRRGPTIAGARPTRSATAVGTRIGPLATTRSVSG